MKVLRIQDAIAVTTGVTERMWEWDTHRLELTHWIPFSNMAAGVQTSLALDGQSIWSLPGEFKVHEVWSDISVVLLAYDILCEPLTSLNVEYSVQDMITPNS